MLRPSPKIDRGSSHRVTNKIEANKTVKTTAHKTTIETITNNNGGPIQATTLTGTR
jgi:hypothetical protein